MSDNLQETITETLKETTETSNVPKIETKEESTPKEETTAGETSTQEKEFVSGIDISDIPVADRPRIRELLSKKAGLLEKGYQTKFQEVAALKRELERLEERGINVDEARQAIDKMVYEKTKPSDTKRADRLLDQLIQQSPDQRSNLEQFRKLVHEESDKDVLQAKIDKIEKVLASITQTTTVNREREVSSALDKLAETYGDELVDKHRVEIMRQAIMYPQTSPKTLLFALAPDDVEKAISAKKPKPVTQEKRNAVSNQPSGITGMETLDESKLSMKDLLRSIGKKK